MDRINQNIPPRNHDTFEESAAHSRESRVDIPPRRVPRELILGGFIVVSCLVIRWSNMPAANSEPTHLPAHRSPIQGYIGDMPISCQSDEFTLPGDIPAWVAERQFADICYPGEDQKTVVSEEHDLTSPDGSEHPGDRVKRIR